MGTSGSSGTSMPLVASVGLLVWPRTPPRLAQTLQTPVHPLLLQSNPPPFVMITTVAPREAHAAVSIHMVTSALVGDAAPLSLPRAVTTTLAAAHMSIPSVT